MNRLLARFALPRERRSGAALLLLALLAAAAAQLMLELSYFEDRSYWDVRIWLTGLGNNTTPIPGLMLYALAAFLFLFSLRALGWTLPALPEPALSPGAGPAAALRLLADLRPAWPLAGPRTTPPARSNRRKTASALAFTWILSLALFAWSVLNQSGWALPRWGEIRAWLTRHRLELAGLVLLLALAAAFRLYDLELFPYSMVNDEGEMGKGALCLLRGECRNIFAIGWTSQPYVAYLPYAFSVGVLGERTGCPGPVRPGQR